MTKTTTTTFSYNTAIPNPYSYPPTGVAARFSRDVGYTYGRFGISIGDKCLATAHIEKAEILELRDMLNEVIEDWK